MAYWEVIQETLFLSTDNPVCAGIIIMGLSKSYTMFLVVTSQFGFLSSVSICVKLGYLENFGNPLLRGCCARDEWDAIERKDPSLP